MSHEHPKLTWWTAWLSVGCDKDVKDSPKPWPSHLHLECSSPTRVHPRAIRCGVWHRLQCDPAVPRPRSPRTTGQLEERGWTSDIQQAPHTWHGHTEHGSPTYHQWVPLWYMWIHIRHISALCLRLNIPFSLRAVGGGWGGVYLWGSEPLRQDPGPGQNHCDWTG